LENKECLDTEISSVSIRFSLEEEKEWYINLRGQLIKLLYMIEAEQKGECTADLWFYGFMHELTSSNSLCQNKLTKVVVKIFGLFEDNKYKTMSHEQIKRQIMESRGIVDHLIKEMEKEK